MNMLNRNRWRAMGCAAGAILFVSAQAALAPAQTWAERSRKMSRVEISAATAQSRSAADEDDRRNKVCVRRIKPAMPGVDWNTDPTAVPYMMYQIGKRTDLPV